MENDDNWLIFGAGSPERRFLGSRFNIGAAALDLIAQVHDGTFVERGPISTTIVEIGGKSVRLIKPNVIPEMIDDAVLLAKTKCRFDPKCVVVIYGDQDYLPGNVKVKRKGGTNGNRIVDCFLRTFGVDDVIRVRVGMGKLPKSAESPLDIDHHDFGPKILKGIAATSAIVDTLITDGYHAAVDLQTEINRGKALV